MTATDSQAQTTPRWSTDDELLVWTVSRIDGGRRHGSERDCHVVYSLTHGHFIEQTRTFRASAEQCIELLQSGRRAGTVQRKIPVDSIMSVSTDDESGRVQIRTINGTHRLDPIGSDEAAVLAEIAFELQLRMPPGGAEFSTLSDGPSHGDRRREDRGGEDFAIAALENARDEDAPDAYQAPRFDVDPTDRAEIAAMAMEMGYDPDAAAPEADPSPADRDPHHVDPHHEDLDRIAVAMRHYVEPGLATEPEKPSEITVLGGVPVTYQPADTEGSGIKHIAPPGHEPSLNAPAEYVPAQDTPIEYVPAQDMPVEYVAAQDTAVEYVPAQELPAQHAPVDEVQVPENVQFVPAGAQHVHDVEHLRLESDRRAGETGRIPFDRRADLPYGASPEGPAGVRDHTVAAQTTGGSDVAATGQSVFVPPSADAQVPTENSPLVSHDETAVPGKAVLSIFDRRGNGAPVEHERPGWAIDHIPRAADTYVDEGEQGSGEDDGQDVTGEDVGQDVAPEVPLSSEPPTLGPSPANSAPAMGGVVGFNPDFDVNPFR